MDGLAQNPIYGGSGAGALNDLYDRVSLQDRDLEDAGYQEKTTELTELHTQVSEPRELLMEVTGAFQKYRFLIIQMNCWKMQRVFRIPHWS